MELFHDSQYSTTVKTYSDQFSGPIWGELESVRHVHNIYSSDKQDGFESSPPSLSLPHGFSFLISLTEIRMVVVRTQTLTQTETTKNETGSERERRKQTKEMNESLSERKKEFNN